MSRRCRAGQRARIISEGPNSGAIVLVERPYFYPEKIGNSVWPRVLRAWVITSLGGPLQSFYLDGGECPPARTIVFDDRNLEPLDDDDDGLDEKEVLERPRQHALAGGNV